MLIHALMIFSLLNAAVCSTTKASVVNFCVANTSLPKGPAGYSCKDPSRVTPDDFFFRLGRKGNVSSNVLGASANLAFAPEFAGVNGLGISMARLDYEVGGVNPFHTHPGASELVLVFQGVLLVGFVASSGSPVYLKTRKSGDVMVIPRGLLHFQLNIGKTPAVSFSSYNSDNPGVQIADYTFFQNNLATQIVSKNTFITEVEVRRLKALFGGTN